jgi:hypothetical protein
MAINFAKIAGPRIETIRSSWNSIAGVIQRADIVLNPYKLGIFRIPTWQESFPCLTRNLC